MSSSFFPAKLILACCLLAVTCNASCSSQFANGSAVSRPAAGIAHSSQANAAPLALSNATQPDGNITSSSFSEGYLGKDVTDSDRSADHAESSPSIPSSDMHSHRSFPTILLSHTTNIRIWFPDSNHPSFASSCAANTVVTRTLQQTKTPHNVVMLLFQGPTPQEKTNGILHPFEARPPTHKPLSAFLDSVRVANDRAIINFMKEAEAWLHSPACAQESIRTSIEKTLQSVFGITKVDYMLDGNIITSWDA